MLKLPTLLDLLPALPAQAAAISTENIDSLEHHNIRRFRTLDIFRRMRLRVEF